MNHMQFRHECVRIDIHGSGSLIAHTFACVARQPHTEQMVQDVAIARTRVGRTGDSSHWRNCWPFLFLFTNFWSERGELCTSNVSFAHGAGSRVCFFTILSYRFTGDAQTAIEPFERYVREYVGQSTHSVSAFVKAGVVISGVKEQTQRDHFVMDSARLDWTCKQEVFDIAKAKSSGQGLNQQSCGSWCLSS